MHFSTSDGKECDVPDMCGFCDMDTGGNHQPNCPLYFVPSYYLPYWGINEMSLRRIHDRDITRSLRVSLRI